MRLRFRLPFCSLRRFNPRADDRIIKSRDPGELDCVGERQAFKEDFLDHFLFFGWHIFIVHFLECFQQGTRGKGLRLSDDVIRALLNYDWPGNVRELANEMRRLVMRSGNNEVIGIADLAPEIRTYADARTMPLAEIIEDYVKISRSLLYSEKQDEVQRLDIIEALTKTNGNQKQAAKMMKMSRNGFKKAAKRLRIDIEKYCQS